MTLSIEELKTDLEQVISRLTPGESVTITRSGKPIATLGPPPTNDTHHPPPRVLGLGKGTFKMSDDFDAPLGEFEE